MSAAGRYLRTLRGLRAQQVLGRPFRPLLRRVLRHVVRPRSFDPAGADMDRILRRLSAIRPVVAGFPDDRGDGRSHRDVAEDACRGAYRFLATERVLERPDWNGRVGSRLWTYHLHYFDYAESLARAYADTGEPRFRARLEELVSDWIARTARRRGDGWDPYPTSTRIDRWVRALALVADDLDAALRARWVGSLDLQARYVARFVERHLRGNHMVRNHKALALAGLVLPGGTGRRLLRQGRRGLERDAAEQVLADGVHYERSPMYHAIVAEDLLHAVALGEAVEPGAWNAVREAAERLVRASAALRRPDGTWHQFGDAGGGHALRPAALDALVARVLGAAPPACDGIVDLEASGYHGWASPANGTKFLVRCGVHGPPDQPGHAHCDLLAFELWIDGVGIAVDTGVRDYEDDGVRAYVRSVGAHSTVMLGGLDQSETWDAFRVGARARARRIANAVEGGTYRFAGECRAYHTEAAHRREVEGEGRDWTVRDRVERAWEGRVTAALHLHPDLRPAAGDDALTFASPGATLRVRPFGYDDVRLVRGGQGAVRGVWYPAFGVERERTTIQMTIHRNDGREAGTRLHLEAPGAAGAP